MPKINNFICNAVYKYLDKKFNPPNIQSKETQFTNCIKIPYFGIQSVYFKKNSRSLLKRILGHEDTSVVFIAPELKQFFQLRTKCPSPCDPVSFTNSIVRLTLTRLTSVRHIDTWDEG